MPANLLDLETPCLLLDEQRLRANVARMKAHLAPLGVAFRPHLKTAKSLDVARIAMTSATGPATVSTLREAEYFAAGGVRDMIYAVGIAPAKLARVSAIRATGADLAVILDSIAQADAVAAHAASTGDAVPALVEVDADGHRSGVAPTDAATLVAIGRRLVAGGATLRGVLLHAGDSYALNDPAAIADAAEAERIAAVTAANALRSAGLPCPVVSVGATPTARYVRDLTGITEVRAGVFMFGDLYQAGVSSVAMDDLVLSVLATVIGHQKAKGWIIADAGWMALSRDRSTAKQALDQGYGVVCDLAGKPYPDLIVTDANQEHGIIALRKRSNAALPDLPIGSRIRILINHACATGAQYDCYQVLDGEGRVSAVWPRINGW
ncbi:D-serine deaminase-like pyridoxal phosphate-dependent protein [Bradyrhizobium japonicum USDA 38]|nr:alanine racemase [Bradyrhizobium japonicum]MCS3893025.1 D-serine deaminase-like pyridoxal phosphate-dependent protein [Bradyrhizobium japonicum USDA 38]MCS3945539.1 D-serine deaminase-like pyridoxal phosphate-dependent protein [Bradyrhizobium japonicum]MCW2221938.1 D-serine deaminase-like pyridoxal phosphate-dependent protein [Bradyrhizobium japonicum]MCW2346551.1 D-serine deaminase-like pyridoxal phosphate-dependent protein [Bradyrhizobium japonicum]